MQSKGSNAEHVIFIMDLDKTEYGGLSCLLREYEFVLISDRGSACDYFLNNRVDLVLLCHDSDLSCFDVLQSFKSVKPSVPVIVLAPNGTEDIAVKAFRNGAKDYFRKPFDNAELAKSVRAAMAFRKTNNKRKSDYLPDHFRSAVEYIQCNFHKKIQLADVAKEAGMSISNFERTFKKKMGVTFTAYVNHHRISNAEKMLKHDSLSVSEIAYACGFTNQFHFSRIFRQITNTSPRRFRKSLKR